MATKNAKRAESGSRDQVIRHFEALRIPVRSEHLDEVLRKAESEGLGHLEFLDALIGEQARQRHERSIERRIKAARFAERRTLEDFDWEFNRHAIDRTQFETLGSADFVARRDNLVIVGQSGVGKSHLVQALGIRACTVGRSVRYTTSADLITDLTSALADKTLPKKLRNYVRPELVIIDEFGFDRVERRESPEAASLLYKVVHARSQKGSTALVTNIDFDNWGHYLGDPPVSMALLDRLVENAAIIRIDKKAKSYRAHQAKRKQRP
ncbi:MAG: IS21-like element helper ATPase IstB [Vicinamibacteria bacterium]